MNINIYNNQVERKHKLINSCKLIRIINYDIKDRNKYYISVKGTINLMFPFRHQNQ